MSAESGVDQRRGTSTLRIALITGSIPPTPCGVGDYTARLATSLSDLGAKAHVVSDTQWGIGKYRGLVQLLDTLRPDVVHIQYPTIGYGSGLAPQMISVLYRSAPVAVTVHEFSQAHKLRQLAVLGFAWRSALLIFVSDCERTAFLNLVPHVRGRSEVIPLASNIPFVTTEWRDPYRVVYFGRIAPRKGLEDFLAAARITASRGLRFRFEVIGSPDIRDLEYLQRLREASRGLSVSWTIGRTPEEVALLLAGSMYAYLPYPDGASDRRGSLLAALGNGTVVLTTKGPHTPPDLVEAVVFVGGTSGAVDSLQSLETQEGERRRLSVAAVRFASRLTWKEIGLRHLSLYRCLRHDPPPVTAPE